MKTVAIQKKSSIQNVRMLTMTAVLSAIAFVLAFFEFPVPLSPSFARMDLSDLPALIGAFAYGPAAGILIELVKNALQLFTSSTGGIGELANFIMGSSFVVKENGDDCLPDRQRRDGNCSCHRQLLYSSSRI